MRFFMLAAAALLAVAVFGTWARNAPWIVGHHGVTTRRPSSSVKAPTKATTTFVVPDSLAADVVRTVVDALGYPTTKRPVSPEMVLLDATECRADFSLANTLHESWVSRLLVLDHADGAHGSYEVVQWTVADGTASGAKDMEIVARRISEIITDIGGTVKVSVLQ